MAPRSTMEGKAVFRESAGLFREIARGGMWLFLDPVNLKHKLRVAIIVTVVMGVAGPFGTYEALGLGPRMLYWTIAVFGCAVLFEIAVDLAIFVVLRTRPIAVQIVLGAFAASFPASAVVLGLETVFRNGMVPAHWPWLFLCVFLVGSVVSILNFHPAFAKLRPRNRGGAAFLARLPTSLGDRLDSLSMNDHYVEAVTAEGSAMIHLRFKKALEELQGYPGLRIHRSHWVALDAIDTVEGSGRGMRLRTRAGRSLPVSDTYRPEVLAAQERGWLPGDGARH